MRLLGGTDEESSFSLSPSDPEDHGRPLAHAYHLWKRQRRIGGIQRNGNHNENFLRWPLWKLGEIWRHVIGWEIDGEDELGGGEGTGS